MPDERKKDRYVVRPDAAGWTVHEIWTGQPARLGGAPQTGLSQADAKHALKLLDAEASRGDSSMRK